MAQKQVQIQKSTQATKRETAPAAAPTVNRKIAERWFPESG
jgi:hypothetical protein